MAYCTPGRAWTGACMAGGRTGTHVRRDMEALERSKGSGSERRLVEGSASASDVKRSPVPDNSLPSHFQYPRDTQQLSLPPTGEAMTFLTEDCEGRRTNASRDDAKDNVFPSLEMEGFLGAEDAEKSRFWGRQGIIVASAASANRDIAFDLGFALASSSARESESPSFNYGTEMSAPRSPSETAGNEVATEAETVAGDEGTLTCDGPVSDPAASEAAYSDAPPYTPMDQRAADFYRSQNGSHTHITGQPSYHQSLKTSLLPSNFFSSATDLGSLTDEGFPGALCHAELSGGPTFADGNAAGFPYLAGPVYAATQSAGAHIRRGAGRDGDNERSPNVAATHEATTHDWLTGPRSSRSPVLGAPSECDAHRPSQSNYSTPHTLQTPHTPQTPQTPHTHQTPQTPRIPQTPPTTPTDFASQALLDSNQSRVNSDQSLRKREDSHLEPSHRGKDGPQMHIQPKRPAARGGWKGGWRTELCKFWRDGGGCRNASTCRWAHGVSELRRVSLTDSSAPDYTPSSRSPQSPFPPSSPLSISSPAAQTLPVLDSPVPNSPAVQSRHSPLPSPQTVLTHTALTHTALPHTASTYTAPQWPRPRHSACERAYDNPCEHPYETPYENMHENAYGNGYGKGDEIPLMPAGGPQTRGPSISNLSGHSSSPLPDCQTVSGYPLANVGSSSPGPPPRERFPSLSAADFLRPEHPSSFALGPFYLSTPPPRTLVTAANAPMSPTLTATQTIAPTTGLQPDSHGPQNESRSTTSAWGSKTTDVLVCGGEAVQKFSSPAQQSIKFAIDLAEVWKDVVFPVGGGPAAADEDAVLRKFDLLDCRPVHDPQFWTQLLGVLYRNSNDTHLRLSRPEVQRGACDLCANASKPSRPQLQAPRSNAPADAGECIGLSPAATVKTVALPTAILEGASLRVCETCDGLCRREARLLAATSSAQTEVESMTTNTMKMVQTADNELREGSEAAIGAKLQGGNTGHSARGWASWRRRWYLTARDSLFHAHTDEWRNLYESDVTRAVIDRRFLARYTLVLHRLLSDESLRSSPLATPFYDPPSLLAGALQDHQPLLYLAARLISQ